MSVGCAYSVNDAPKHLLAFRLFLLQLLSFVGSQSRLRGECKPSFLRVCVYIEYTGTPAICSNDEQEKCAKDQILSAQSVINCTFELRVKTVSLSNTLVNGRSGIRWIHLRFYSIVSKAYGTPAGCEHPPPARSASDSSRGLNRASGSISMHRSAAISAMRSPRSIQALAIQ